MLLFCTAPIPDRGDLISDILDIHGVVSVQELVTGEENLLVTAVGEAERRGITGKAVTPFLLSRIAELTDGESLETNIALARNNAELGGRVAAALAERGEG